MLKALLSRVSFFRQRALTLSHRNDQLKADAAERRERWNEVIAEHQKPLGPQPAASTPSSGRVCKKLMQLSGCNASAIPRGVGGVMVGWSDPRGVHMLTPFCRCFRAVPIDNRKPAGTIECTRKRICVTDV